MTNLKENTVLTKIDNVKIDNVKEVKAEMAKIVTAIPAESEKVIGVIPLKNVNGIITYGKGTSCEYVKSIFITYLKDTGKEGKAVLDSRYDRKEVAETLKKKVIAILRTSKIDNLSPEEKAIKNSGNALGRVDRTLSDIAYKIRLGLSL